MLAGWRGARKPKGCLERHCACGVSLTGQMCEARSARELHQAFDRAHDGPQCAPATAEQAARRRAESAL